MYYRVNIEDGYIHGVVEGVNEDNANITKEEYIKIKDIIKNTPKASDGFYYRLKDNLEWELCELPTIEETVTETDYQKALERLGVTFNE
jgi:hypothetical protein